jgi:hypothetical protein
MIIYYDVKNLVNNKTIWRSQGKTVDSARVAARRKAIENGTPAIITYSWGCKIICIEKSEKPESRDSWVIENYT